MTKDEFILATAQQLLLGIAKDWEDGEGLVELADECYKAAELIWKKTNPLQ